MLNGVEKNQMNYTWKPEAGKKIFWIAVGLLFLNQIVFQSMELAGVKMLIPAPILNTIICGGIIIWHGTTTIGLKKSIIAFFTLYLVALFFESNGVNHGWFYGPYHYNDFMGPRVFGVPFTVPLSWQLNMYPAFYLTAYLIPSSIKLDKMKMSMKILLVLLFSLASGIICTYVDIIRDPVFVGVGNAWIWHIPGDYFPEIYGGIPLVNFLGWIATGFTGSFFYFFIKESTPAERHIKSNYINLGIPLALFTGALIFPIIINILIMKSEVIWLNALFGMGFIIILTLSKFFFTKFGYEDARTPE